MKKTALYKQLYKPVCKVHLAGVSYYLLYILPKGRKKPAGPYWYAYFRRSGKVKCKYIGKSLTEISKCE